MNDEAYFCTFGDEKEMTVSQMISLFAFWGSINMVVIIVVDGCENIHGCYDY